MTEVLAHGDKISAGPLEIVVHIEAPAVQPIAPGLAFRAPHFHAPPQPVEDNGREELRQQVLLFREQCHRIEEEQEKRARGLERQEQELQGRSADVERDRTLWDQRRQEIEQECRRQQETAASLLRAAEARARELSAPALDLQRREEALALQAEELRQRETALEKRSAELDAQHSHRHIRVPLLNCPFKRKGESICPSARFGAAGSVA